MSVFDQMLGEDGDEQQQTIDRLLKSYYRFRLLDTVAEKGLDYVTGNSGDRELEHTERVLSIAQRKRALGIPYDDDDYEKATNENRPFRTNGVVAAFGKTTSDLIPEPGFLRPKPFLPFAQALGSENINTFGLQNLGKKIKSGVSKYAPSDQLSRIARFFK